MEKQKGVASSMKISIKEVENVAALARLHLTEKEKEKFSYQLNDILTHIEKLNQLSTDGVDTVCGEFVLKNPIREDIGRPSFFYGEIMLNAPEKGKGYFKVPKIIE